MPSTRREASRQIAPLRAAPRLRGVCAEVSDALVRLMPDNDERRPRKASTAIGENGTPPHAVTPPRAAPRRRPGAPRPASRLVYR